MRRLHYLIFFFFNDTATTEIYTLSLHDALPISAIALKMPLKSACWYGRILAKALRRPSAFSEDRKSTRLNSSHANISYAVFCLKKKKQPYDCSPTLWKRSWPNTKNSIDNTSTPV